MWSPTGRPRLAEYKTTGTLTSPNVTVPDQIGRPTGCSEAVSTSGTGALLFCRSKAALEDGLEILPGLLRSRSRQPNDLPGGPGFHEFQHALAISIAELCEIEVALHRRNQL